MKLVVKSGNMKYKYHCSAFILSCSGLIRNRLQVGKLYKRMTLEFPETEYF